VQSMSCSAGVCNSTCTVNWGNCVQPAFPAADDGCETDTGTSTSACGGCGRACSAANVATLACSSGLCTSSCAAGAGNCLEPAYPSADDGCETDTTIDPANCGTCGMMCVAPTPNCVSSMCSP